MADQRPPFHAPRWALVVPWLLLGGARAFAQNGDPATVAAQARALLSAGEPSEAITLLKSAIERQPEDRRLRLWLARAYLDDGNEFWALRTVGAATAIHPEDCGLTLWQAYIQLKQGALDQARELLQAPCNTWPPVAARRALLLAKVEQAAGATSAARRYLDQASVARFAFPEDREAITQMRTNLEPRRLTPLSGRIDLAMGGTSNARAGSPVDPASQGSSAGSLAVQAAASMRFVSPNPSWARFSLEGEARGLGYQADTGRDYSYLLLSGRPALLVEVLGRQALVGYRYESLLLAGGDKLEAGPLWFYDAHRGEWELELWPWLTFFGGAGKRSFRELVRTRIELDGGVGGGYSIAPWLQVMGALSGRYHAASNDAKDDAAKHAYDLRGVSLLLSADLRARNRWSARVGALVSADNYPHSTGYFDAEAQEKKNRHDRTLRVSLSVFAPPFRSHLKLGVTYEFAVRDSTADAYDYADHRVLAKLIWTFTADPWLPRPVTPHDHVPIDYRLETVEAAERVQDLLRQGEAAQRSTSCRE
jgi:hypothetical protein